MRQAISRYWPEEWSRLSHDQFSAAWLSDPAQIRQIQLFLTLVENEIEQTLDVREFWRQPSEVLKIEQKITQEIREVEIHSLWDKAGGLIGESGREDSPKESVTALAIQTLFEKFAEHKLKKPTFITDFPKAISPLSKASPSNPAIAERFELFIAGMECANGFSELNDPEEQYQRFKEQTQQRECGDEEAMVMDADYIRALSYGMPPAAGIGIGIDRFVMLLTNRQSIRDVILFPHLRPERKQESEPPAVAGG